MRKLGAMSWGAKGLLLVTSLALGLGATAGCSDNNDAAASGGQGGMSRGGGGGVTAGKSAGYGGAEAGRGGGGAGGSAAGAGGEATCDCGTDVNQATIPLACACDAGLCTTFAEDLAKLQTNPQLGSPYYVLLGTCDDGYRTLTYEEATEQRRQRTYDADGQMVYDHFGGYGPIAVPKACGFTESLSLGSSTVGQDSSKNCSYCLVASDDEGAGGAGGAGATFYPESRTARCDPAQLE